MDSFRFIPELFEYRNDVMNKLGDRGFDWLTHYSSVDPMHDLCGIEVCGIHQERDARAILGILHRMFPDWRWDGLYYKDYGREPGWIARIHRDPSPARERWETAG
jgi:hypothetical protein